MSRHSYLPWFVGSLWLAGVPRSAFVCYRQKILISCEHGFPSGDRAPDGLIWNRFRDSRSFDLAGSLILVREKEDDILILLSQLPLVPSSQEVPDLPPKGLFRSTVDVQFNGVGLYPQGVEEIYHEVDSGSGRIIGHGGSKGGLVKLSSQNVTRGFSGSALICETDVGLHILGMISGKYNSGDHTNRDTAWAVDPGKLRTAIQVAAEFARVNNVDDPSLAWAPDLDVGRLQLEFSKSRLLGGADSNMDHTRNTALSNLQQFARDEGG